MRATSIPAFELDFARNGKDTAGNVHQRKPFSIAIPGTTEQVPMVLCTRADAVQSFYFREETRKERIVLHYTAGYLKGDIAALTRTNYRVSTPFVIARDGTIYNLWASKYWSYHLGVGAEGGNQTMSRSGIGIEISNIGWLTPSGGDLITYMSRPGAPDVYCRRDEQALYTELPTPYRQYAFYATYTEAQYTSLVQLLRFLSARYGIPLDFLDEGERYGVLRGIGSFRGVTSHVNYRPQGKWDIGPAFDWQRVIAGVAGRVAPPRTVPLPNA
jgi:N-acetylmuramoyl-L-alanine amidase